MRENFADLTVSKNTVEPLIDGRRDHLGKLKDAMEAERTEKGVRRAFWFQRSSLDEREPVN